MKETTLFRNKKILITGAAGFIGGSLIIDLLTKVSSNTLIVGIDNLNDYYDVDLKKYRLNTIMRICKKSGFNNWHFIQGDIADRAFCDTIFKEIKPHIVVNFAAQAGVRYSLSNPNAYLQSNVIGFFNILEECRELHSEPNTTFEHLIYASSSSVYGGNIKIPFSVEDKVDSPVSFYAATKRSNELFAYTYSKLYNIYSTGLRFFTVYGPAGRPDMAYYKFTKQFISRDKIKVYNYGKCERDFTYIDDIIHGIELVMINEKRNMESIVPHYLYNIGHGKPEGLLTMINLLKNELIQSNLLPENYELDKYIEYVEMQPGDVQITYADTNEMKKDFGYQPRVGLKEGIKKFVSWYKEYYTT